MIQKNKSISVEAKALFSFLFVILMINSVYAIGISYNEQNAIVKPGAEKCFKYGLYNTQDKDLNVNFRVSDDLQEIYAPNDGSTSVAANTPLDNPVYVNFCFDIPSDTYEEGRTEPLKKYVGNVYVSEIPSSGVGSVTSAGVVAPVTIEVLCDKSSSIISWKLMLLFLLVIIIVVVIIFFIVKKMKSKKSQVNSTNYSSLQQGQNFRQDVQGQGTNEGRNDYSQGQ